MALGMWVAVGPSNHVLDGGPDPPMVRGNFGGFPPPLKSIIGLECRYGPCWLRVSDDDDVLARDRGQTCSTFVVCVFVLVQEKESLAKCIQDLKSLAAQQSTAPA